jgi:hypothetical protein
MKPTAEAALYDDATVAEPLVETPETVLPVSGLGMAARKRALRERRAIPAHLAAELAAAGVEPTVDGEAEEKPKRKRKRNAE